MKRRNFAKNILTAAVATQLPLSGNAMFYPLQEQIIRPKALKKGSRVMLVSPASSAPEKEIEKAIKKLGKLGYSVVESPHLREKNGYFAGTTQERLKDFHKAWKDPEIDGIWCLRGGYGTTRYIDEIDFSLVKNNPKVFIGYSDITALHNAIFKHTGLVTFHGPLGTSDDNKYSTNGFEIFRSKKAYKKEKYSQHSRSKDTEKRAKKSRLYMKRVFRAGQATGRLAGGNLTLLASLCGTRHMPNFENRLVYLEDVGEKPYRIDRMLTQVRQASDLNKAAGIIHGVYSDCEQKDPQKQDLEQVIEETLGDLPIPQLYGLSFGHIEEQFTIPNGIRAEMDTVTFSLKFLEAAVQ